MEQTVIEVVKGDITKEVTEAIVNAANTSLLGGGGVDGAIHRAGGNEILDECKDIRNKQGKCKVGEAVITTGGNLKAKYVIHTVGPVWNGGNSDEEQLLYNAYTNSLKLADENDIDSIAFPNISTGIYKFPKPLAAEIALNAVNTYLVKRHTFKKIRFVCFDEENYTIYSKLIE
jgi:O-acetyl-ADP-ribose deacetylase (regulator of RNase III)